MPRGPAFNQGLPELPYVRHTSYAGADVLLSLTFLNSSSVPTQPTSITYEMDSLDSTCNVIPSTVLVPTGVTQILQLPAASMQLTQAGRGRENMQVLITAVIADTNATSGSITVQQIVMIELINIST
jgi:hypothetical protein